MSQTEISDHRDAQDLVRKALRDPRWDFRTVEGIAKQTGLSEDAVAEALADLGDEVRKSDVPDAVGRPLFTHRSRPVPMQERMSKLRNFLAKSTT
jgi:hypothetical protein